jgi:5-methylcytosine-specific restriction protein A
MPTAAEFREALAITFQGATMQGLPHIDVIAGWLHEEVGEYPGPEERMPMCCAVMRGEMRPGDQVVEEPPRGVGASLTIRYRLPRS